MFREGVYKTILLSRIGDEAIDLPNANVAIEINIHKGSRRQMLQRLGRIMRPKDASSSESYNAIFYTIVTVDTLEMAYFRKRRECLVNLGFQYDLRFCEFGDPNVSDILRDDKETAKIIRERFEGVVPSEHEYWNIMKNDRDND
jgi:DNA excision repair protein ERCC-3